MPASETAQNILFWSLIAFIIVAPGVGVGALGYYLGWCPWACIFFGVMASATAALSVFVWVVLSPWTT